jgi:hypothetical protein
MKRLAKTYAFVALASLGLLSVPVAGGEASPPQPTEYRLKAAFLFNFAKFVDWPDDAFTNATAPLVIGILGQFPSNDGTNAASQIEATIRDKKINNHPLQVSEIQSLAKATNCHILFISISEEKRLTEIFDALRVAPVLTVGDGLGGFTKAGGMINFVVEANKIRFHIDNDRAKNARLRISSRLLSLALPPP